MPSEDEPTWNDTTEVAPTWDETVPVDRQPPAPLTNVAAMKSGVAEMSPEARAAAAEVVKAVPQAIEGAQTGAMAVATGGGSLITEALTPQPVKDFMRTPLVSPESVDVARQAAQYPIPTLSNILFGTDYKEQGPLAAIGKFASDQIAGQITPENLALVAGTEGLGAANKILARKAPTVAEALFGSRVAKIPEVAATEAEVAKGPPPVPKKYEIPQLMGSPTFTLVPEPKPEIAPVQPIEQQVAELPSMKVKQTPEGDVPILDETRSGRTGIQAETAKIGGDTNAKQVTETAQPDVNVQSTGGPKEGETVGGEVPATESGTGVPARGQGEEVQQVTENANEKLNRILGTKGKIPESELATQPEQPRYTSADTADEPALSRLANRHTEERAAAGELGQIAPGQGYSKMDLVKQGEKMSPEEVNQHVSDLMQKTGDPIKQASAVSVEEARLSKRSSDLSRAAAADPTNVEAKLAADNAFKDLTDFHNGPVARLKEVFHGTGEGLQGEVPVDISTVNGLREAYFKDTGKLPTAAMDKNFESTAARVSKSIEGENGARAKLSSEIEKQAASRKLPSPDEVRNSIRERMGLEPCPT